MSRGIGPWAADEARDLGIAVHPQAIVRVGQGARAEQQTFGLENEGTPERERNHLDKDGMIAGEFAFRPSPYADDRCNPLDLEYTILHLSAE